jgi:hypothetical protein
MAHRLHRMNDTTDYICYNIDWETDGDQEALDTLSDETGWLHNGFDIKKA